MTWEVSNAVLRYHVASFHLRSGVNHMVVTYDWDDQSWSVFAWGEITKMQKISHEQIEHLKPMILLKVAELRLINGN